MMTYGRSPGTSPSPPCLLVMTEGVWLARHGAGAISTIERRVIEQPGAT